MAENPPSNDEASSDLTKAVHNLRAETRPRNLMLDAFGSMLLALAIPAFLSDFVPSHRLAIWSVSLSVVTLVSVVGIKLTQNDSTKSYDGIDRFWTAGNGIFVAIVPWLSTEVRTDATGIVIVFTIVACVVASDSVFLPQSHNKTWRQWSLLELASAAIAFSLGSQWLWALFLLGYGAHMLGGSSSIDKLVTERMQSEAEAELATNRSLADELTGYANRRALELGIDELLTGESETITCAFFDLDDLKQVNDLFGHSAGDHAIRGTADHLNEALGQRWLLGRLGGDEFVAVSNHLDAHEDLSGIHDLTVSYGENRDQQLRLSMSVGVTVLERESASRAQLLHEAGAAMRQAKHSNKGETVQIDASLRSAFEARLSVASEVGLALSNGEIRAWGQTIHDTTTNRIVGVECLARWRRADGSLELPDTFVPVIEQKGLSATLGMVMLKQAIQFADQFTSSNGDALPYVSVNISAGHFASGVFVEEIASVLQQSRLAAHRLVIEITETQNLLELPRWQETAHRLRRLGVRLAIDDFGSGYSSISSLIEVPADFLKIDRSLTIASSNQAGSRLLRGVVEFAEQGKLTAVAEGVETAEDLASVLAVGVRVVQGWFFSKAEPLEAVAKKINAQSDADREPDFRQLQTLEQAESNPLA